MGLKDTMVGIERRKKKERDLRDCIARCLDVCVDDLEV